MDKAELIARQKAIDEEYVKYGLTDEIVDKQVELNKLRNQYNIDITDEEYVQ